MIPIEHIQQILHRVEKGRQTDEDIKIIRKLLLDGDRQILQQLGKYNVNIGQGRDIHIGDRVYQQWDEEAIKALVKAIQQVTWRCIANLTENDYTQSIGISIIDKLSKQLTDFSQQSVMRYGLKLAFSPNFHQEYFISSGNQVIKRWQTNKWEMLREISVPFSITDTFDLWFTAVAISPNSQLIAACKAYQVNVWNLGTDNLIHTFGKTVFSNFFDVFGFDSVAFSPDSKILAANDNRDIKLWDIETGKEITKLSGHTDKVTCVAFNPNNGRILASCSYDKTIKLWDIAEKRCLGTLSAHRDAVYTLAFSPDGEIIASGSNDNSIKLWNLNMGEIPETLRQHSDAVTCLVFSPDGKILVSGGNDGKIVEWNIAKKESQILPQQHSRGVTSIAISPDGETLISGGRDQTIKVWRR
jgi:WD40 repeat protein